LSVVRRTVVMCCPLMDGLAVGPQIGLYVYRYL